MKDSKSYTIPARFRKIENLHILFWLLKDACWALNFKYPALFMILPTMGAAFLITWQTRKLLSEFVHNLSVVFWIAANCIWMVGEFFGLDEGRWGLRNMALLPFGMGLLILGGYYLLYLINRPFKEKILRQTEQISDPLLGSDTKE